LAVLGLGAAAFGGILQACKSVTTSSSAPTSATPATSAPGTATAAASATLPEPTPLPSTTLIASPTAAASAGYPDLVVVRKGEPEALVRRAIASLGGMERFVPRGANVIVKPNICVSYRTYEYAATTNPWVVGTLVKMAFEAGASSVKVVDYPYGGGAADAYTRSGIGQQVQAAGGQMVVMADRKYVSTRVPAGKWLKRTDVYDEILKADVLINVPIGKVHSSATLTLGMKNLMGVVRDRSSMHGNLGQAIADLNTLIVPDLTVVDCVRILTGNGPSGGRLSDVKKLDTIIAGTDIVAADSYAATLFGLKPNDLDYIRIGAAMGLGRSDLSELRVEELSA
jgi:uncharacterized protein (DUF362 family)